MNNLCDEDPSAYFSGDRLFGDDLPPDQIREWYEAEKDAYAQLGAKDSARYQYGYHALNLLHGYRHLPDQRFERVLGFGSAYGHEFLPIVSRIGELTIVEPSSSFVREVVCGRSARYVGTSPDGTLPFDDCVFDLVTCLGVLHHLPNVTYVVRELARVMKPEAFALIREPIISLGDWRRPRPGLTRRERGIPIELLRRSIHGAGFRIHHESLCGFRPIAIVWNRMGRLPYNSRLATRVDHLLSRAFRWNLHYHATQPFHKLRPSGAYFVLQQASHSRKGSQSVARG